MGAHDKLFNDLPFEERKRLSPYMIELQILHLKQARAVLVRNQKRALQELDDWIKNCERSLASEVSERNDIRKSTP